ncbi:MAG: hypothetical protein JRN26_06735 [Nitrososphaerota archaeon]|nr:hypothetical protein [Nitrososphaerota archaeon]MDG6931436.1 hypothetical protein [Nitrososphaerota archaeon]MDG6936558.1 hypothetical protein [Nitrososphaerota archaeon]MDG6944211.1 hypothetical protein [Nitrososphaerota archaeon]
MYRNGGCGGRRHGQGFGQGFGLGQGFGCGQGFGPGFGQGQGLSGMPRGTGRLIYAALAGGPKAESEIKDYINSYAGFQIAQPILPVLDFWVATGRLKKREDGKYELALPATPGRW